MIMGVVVMAADLQDLCATDNYPAVIPIAFLGSDSIKYLQVNHCYQVLNNFSQ